MCVIRRSARLAPFLALSLLTAGCGSSAEGPRVPVTVMTRNLYLGSDLDSLVLSSSLEELRANAARIWGAVQASDFPARAELIADEIGAASPHLVALQEVALFRTQVPGDFAPGAIAPNATEVAIDFLSLLTNALAARNLPYQIVNESVNGDAELPAGSTADGLLDLRLTDRDVILARTDVVVTEPRSAPFAQNLAVPVGGTSGPTVTFLRGWSSVAAEVGGAHFRFANSHLEVGGPIAFIQETQARELVKALRGLEGALIVAGDFNSAADRSSTQSYGILTQDLGDAYGLVHPDDDSKTCCNAADLKNPVFAGRERIDLVLQRGGVHAVEATLVGTDPARRTAAGQWPSDHAGVVATLGVSF